MSSKERRITTDKTDAYLKAAFRRIWRWSKARREVLQEACIGHGKYKCAICKMAFPRGQVAVDHAESVVDPKVGFAGWDVYYIRLFRGVLQVICRKCHKKKTAAENKERRYWRKLKKEKGE